MSNILNRVQLDLNKPLADYEPHELVAYLNKYYKNAPKEALELFRDNLEVGSVLYQETLTILEGLGRC